jgi:glycopeptide antibiotics resistance protein
MPTLLPDQPLVLASVVVLGLAVWLIGRRTSGASVAALMTLAWGLVVAATLTPDIYFVGSVYWTPGCSFVLQLGDSPHERLANVALFVPLGVVTWFAVPRWIWVAVGAAAPFVIEAAQGVLPSLGRQCDASDVAANFIGFLLGLATAAAATWVVWRLSRFGAE